LNKLKLLLSRTNPRWRLSVKPPDEQRRSVPKNSRAFFGMSKETIDSGQLICGSLGLKLPTAELVAAPLRIVVARESPHFLPP